MIEVPKTEWDKIPKDFKGIWDEKVVRARGDVPLEYIGKRTVFSASIGGDAGTALLTEDVHCQ